MDTAQKLDHFLASVEGRAFRIARLAVRNDEDALDIVQEAMMKLVQKYAAKSEQDWPALFYTILNSRIHDFFRRSQVRNRWRVWFGAKPDDDDQDYDPIVNAADSAAAIPEEQLIYQQSVAHVDQALAGLPTRQRQAFLLRMWEGFSVEETATIMGCSQGSVKTHCSRALDKLKKELT